MAREILIIGHVGTLPTGGIFIGVNTGNETMRLEWKKKSFTDLENLFTGKLIKIFGEEYEIQTKILDVKITASLADFKNIFLKIEENAMTKKIQELDEVEIEL
jgi:hypothetical protein